MNAMVERKTKDQKMKPRSSLVLNVVIILVLIFYTAFFLYRASRYLAFPYPLDPGDGPVLSVAGQIAAGNGIYRDIDELPFVSANYTPLYYVFNALAIKLMGPSFFAGRLLSLLATIALSGLIFKIVWDRTRDKYAAFVTALLLISLGPIYQWSTVYKADMSAVALAMLGFYLLTKERPRPIVAAIALLLAFLTKQTTITALAAGVLYLGLRAFYGDQQSKKNLLTYTITAGGLGLAILTVLDIISNGQLYSHILILNLQRQFWLQQEIITISYFTVAHIVILTAASVIGVRSLRFANDGWAIYFFVALLSMMASIGKLGSSNNYYIEPLSIACVLFGSAFAQRKLLGKRFLALTVIQLVLLFHLPYVFEQGPTPTESDFAVAKQLEERISAVQGPVLAENSGWLPIAGRMVILDDTFFFAEMARSGMWDQSDMVSLLGRKYFSLLVFEFDPRTPEKAEWYHTVRFTPEMLNTIAQEYQVDSKVGGYYLLIRREVSAQQR